MIRIQETIRSLPFYRPIPLTHLPLLYHREHLFPYTSYGDTEITPVPRELRMVVLENEFLRVAVAPELGGRIYSLFDKRIGQEILFSNPVVKPVRILPIWAFISGGIEFNYPIAHSPTSIAPVGYSTGQTNDYGFIRVGEREARTGLEWVVEIGLKEGSPVLVQRTALRNQTGAGQPWMMWTIAAVRSSEATEYIHPPHRVLIHADRLMETDWPGNDLNWDRNYHQMTALFWKPGSAPHFGVFHHDLGFGLMHWADPQQLPGKKVWTYGYGQHRPWGQATTEGDFSYAELESGPLFDQSEKPLFPNDAEHRYVEFWVPIHSRMTGDQLPAPAFDLPPWPNPWLGWTHSKWQSEWEQFRQGMGDLPDSVVPTGLALEPALRYRVEKGDLKAVEPLALWLAFHGRPQEALPLIRDLPQPSAQRLAGLILWKALNDPQQAVAHLEAGPLHDPIARVELDELYSRLNLTSKRGSLLGSPSADPPNSKNLSAGQRLLIERQADLALTLGCPKETLRLLSETPWPREHQRYVRTQLWQKAQSALGEPMGKVPDFLHEDNLASYGAYWSDKS